jgi:hypothetical protein
MFVYGGVKTTTYYYLWFKNASGEGLIKRKCLSPLLRLTEVGPLASSLGQGRTSVPERR